VRPFDIEVLRNQGPGAMRATVARLVRLGSKVRVDALTSSGQPVSVQLTRAQALGLESGARLHLRSVAPGTVASEAVATAGG
jgi:hypothetical protein